MTTVDRAPSPRARLIMYGVVVLLLVVLAAAAMAAWRHARAGRVCADPTGTVTRAELAIITTYCPDELAELSSE